MTVPATVRKLVLLGTPVLAVVVIGISSVALMSELPEEVPSHWGVGGMSDDSMPLWAVTTLFATMAGGLGLLFQSLRHRLGEPVTQKVVGGLGVGIAVWLTALHVGILLAARGTEGPIPFPRGALWAAFALAGVATVLAAAVVRPIERHGAALTATALEIEKGEAVVWHGRGTAARWTWALLASTLLPVPVLVAAGLPWVGLLLVVVGAGAVTVLRVRVIVGPQGLTVRTGPFGVIRYRVPLDEVESVHAEVIDPLAYGGWGLRWLPGVRGLVVRRGPGLRIERRQKATLVVTVDDAPAAAGVLLAHIAAVGGSGGVRR